MAGAIELARVYVTIMPETSRIAPGMRRMTGDVTRHMGMASRAMSNQMVTGMSTASAQSVRALKEVQKHTAAVAKAEAARRDQLGRIRIAQAGLEDLNRRSTVTARARATAQEGVARAMRKESLLAQDLAVKTRMLTTAQQQAKAARMAGGIAGGSYGRMQAQAMSAGLVMESQLTSGMQRAAQRGGSAMLGTLRRVGTATAAVAGLGGVFAATGVLRGGMDRLQTIQDATVSMRQLMGDAGAADTMVSRVTELAQGTPYAADQFLGMARGLIAMGAASEQVVPSIQALANAVAADGGDPAKLEQLSTAYGKIAAQGKITGGEVLSLSQAGVPALAILANSMGLTASEAQKMISKGLVPAGEAIDALNRGIMEGTDGPAGATRAVAGVMEELRKTYSGSMLVLGSQQRILAANFLRPLFDRAPAGLNALSDKMKTLGPAATQLGTGLADGIERFLGFLSSPGVKTGLGLLKTGVTDIADAVRVMGPGLASAARAVGTALAGGGITVWTTFASTLKLIAPLVNSMASAFGNSQGVVTALGIAMGALYLRSRLLPPALKAVEGASLGWAGTIGALRLPLRDVTDRTTGMVRQTGLLSQAQAGLLGPVGRMRMAYLQGAQQAAAFGRSQQLNTQFARDLRSQMVDQLGPWGRFRTSVGDTTTRLRSMQGVMGATRAATTGLSIAGRSLVYGVFGGPLGLAITGATAGLGFLAAKHAEAAVAAEEHKRAEQELLETLDKVTGRITEGSREKVKDRFQAEDQYGTTDIGRAKSFGIDPSQLIDAATGTGDANAYANLRARASDSINQFMASTADQQMRKALQEAGVGSADLTSALLREGNSWDEVNAKITAYVQNTDNSLSNRTALVSGLQTVIDVMPDVNESIVTLLQNVNRLRTGFDAGAAKIREGRQALDGTWEATDTAVERFRELGATILQVPNGKTVVVDVLDDEARQKLDDLGVKIEDAPDGTVTITAETDQAVAEFEKLLQKVEAATPALTVDADTTRAQERVDAFLRNIASAAPTIPVTVEPGGGMPGSLGSFLPPARARGGMYDVYRSVASFASGKLPKQAMLQRPVAGAGLVQWAEPSTHGEAFIPLSPANRARSLAIWVETGRRLGASMRSYDKGGLNPGPAYLHDVLMQQFPQIGNIGGYRAPDGFNEHSSGNAMDVMIPGWDTPQGRALGNAVAAFALTNGDALGLTHVLWQQRSFRTGDRTGTPMEDRGDATQNHLDHVHIFMNRNGGQLPTAPLVTHGSASVLGGGGGGRGGGASAAAARRVRNAQNRVDDSEFGIRQAQQRLEELPDDAKQSRREAAERALEVAIRRHQDALEDLTEAQAHAAEVQDKANQRGESGSSGPDAKSFGQELFSGLLSGMGFDGDLFSDPTQWGISKLGTGVANLLGGMLLKGLGRDDDDSFWGSAGLAGPGNFGFSDGGLGGGGGGPFDGLMPVLDAITSSIQPTDNSTPLANSQSGKAGNNYTTNQHSNNTTTTGQVFNGPINVTNNSGPGQTSRADGYLAGLPGGRK
ncbi:hypothetical protein A5649_13450 [Mycolicibacter heraklionensis]|uniref:Tape measure protein n=1 Tax=Mycolicibacter heraklionensis TaxID=512402 RepID=A0AA91F3J9_9MYCO|nr:tape measure protein [Mycolicibacter heraklionensis]OBK89452.1 hypothetical protein A5649_13450 [Mycolicibacter heraklionensis]